jgi:peptidoglycan/LPS O-acetylase OafA/YrhL
MGIGFGCWRFFLAFLVVISHLWSGMIDGPAAYAVWGFFVLSGFLMTFVLSEKYGPTRSGLTDFAYNRFLRIMPAYWITCLLGVATLLVMPRFGISPAGLNPQFVMPASVMDWVKNVTLLPLTDGGALLVPVSGALAVEVGVYILMPLMAFSRASAWLALILGGVLNLKYGLQVDSFNVRYSSFLTCFPVFAFGSLVCHYRAHLGRIRTPFSVLVWLVHAVLWVWFDQWPWTYGLYSSALLSAWVVLSIAHYRTGPADNVLGDLSYPLYLLHTTVAVWLMPFFAAGRPFTFFVSALVLTLLVSWLLVTLLDKQLKRLKRKKAAPTLASGADATSGPLAPGVP